MLFLRFGLLAQWREHYPRKWYIVNSFLSAVIALWVYKMTSKAIGPGIIGEEWGGLDYFSFIVIGELALLLPLSALDSFSRGVRYAHFSGFLDFILLQCEKPFRKLFEISASTLLRDLMDLFFQFSLAYFFFDLQFSPGQFLSYLSMLILSFPSFMIFGALVGLMILVTGRGGGLVGQALFIVSILSGVYFPTTVFPEWVQNYVVSNLPTAAIAESVRGGGFPSFISVLIWVGSFFFLAVLFRYFGPLSLKLRHSQNRVDVPLN